jgi:hypothetical protein
MGLVALSQFGKFTLVTHRKPKMKQFYPISGVRKVSCEHYKQQLLQHQQQQTITTKTATTITAATTTSYNRTTTTSTKIPTASGQ